MEDKFLTQVSYYYTKIPFCWHTKTRALVQYIFQWLFFSFLLCKIIDIFYYLASPITEFLHVSNLLPISNRDRLYSSSHSVSISVISLSHCHSDNILLSSLPFISPTTISLPSEHTHTHTQILITTFIYLFLHNILSLKWSETLVSQSCPTLCNPMDYSPPGSSVNEIPQARIQEWVAISFSRVSSQPRNWTWVSGIASRFFFYLSYQGLFHSYYNCIWNAFNKVSLIMIMMMWLNMKIRVLD